MMMKGHFINQQPHPALDQENMSNLTSASGETSVSDTNGGGGGSYPQEHFFANPNQSQPQPAKKKRNQPGNPDPGAEVIALSPTTLLARNRFVCEICNKGFQREQNLQLHRRGHNLPWKLKQRTNKEVRKKVYVCPVESCVHHDPSRALGDLTGIKKHFCRKHGEKKWKCDKCSKRYAVQSDWKAHSKICGTKEYTCDCGTLFTRRDSFVTHRAFCDALAEEGARRGITESPIIHPSTSNISFQFQPLLQFSSHGPSESEFSSSIKEEEQYQEIPPWLTTFQLPLVGATHGGPPPPIFRPGYQYRPNQEFEENTNSNLGGRPTLPSFFHPTTVSAGISATALLQKAADQMGASCSKAASMGAPVMLMFGAHTDQEDENSSSAREAELFINDGVVGNKKREATPAPAAPPHGGGSLLRHMTTAATDPHGFDDPFGAGGMTKDFLGLRPLSHADIFNIIDEEHSRGQSHKAWPSC